MKRRIPRSKAMIVTVETKTGKIVKVVDEYGRKPKEISPTSLEKIYRSRPGFKYVATILHTHSSPGCVVIIIGGRPYLICW
jgi:hypothetical protein